MNVSSNAPAAEPEGESPRGALGTLGQRLFTHGAIYLFGSALAMLLGLVRLVVLTRILEISVYGQLTLLLLAAGFVTMFCRVLIVTGTIRSAFRGGDDEEADPDDDSLTEPTTEPTYDQRRALGTGLIGSVGLTLLIAAGTAAFAAPLSEMLIDISAPEAIVLAAAMGGINASYHLVSVIARLERRPMTYVSLQVIHTVAGLVVAAALIEAGYGLDGAITGLIIGSLLAFIPAVFVSRHRFSLVIDFGFLGTLFRLGLPFAGIIVGFWLFRNGDLFMVSRFLDSADVAIYQVASRVGTFASAIVGGLIMAWGPLMRGPLRGALHREGRIEAAGARMLTYFWLTCSWLLVALVLLQDQLARLAPSEYGEVAGLIPLLGVSALAGSIFLVIYRTSRMKGKRRWFILLALVMPALMIGLSFILIPRYDLYGAAIAGMAAPIVAGGLMLSISQRSPERLDLPWRRMAAGAAVAVVWAAGFAVARDLLGSAGIVASIAGVVSFPAALVAVGALPRAEARALVGLLPRRSGAAHRDGLGSLTQAELLLLGRLLRDGEPLADVAQSTGVGEDAALARLVSALRKAGDAGEPLPVDAEIGRYLLSTHNVNLRDRAGHILALDRSLDPLEVDHITAAAERVRRLSRRRWRALQAEAQDSAARD